MRHFESSRKLAAGALLVAVLLNVCLTRYATQDVTTYAGYSESVRGPLSEPILVTWAHFIDFACFRPCQVGGASSLTGFFSRDVAPRNVAIWGGLVVPLILICASVQFAFGFRRFIAVVIFVPGLVLTTILGLELFREPARDFWAHLFERYGSWQILPPMLFGAILMASGIWLWRTRSPKQPA